MRRAAVVAVVLAAGLTPGAGRAHPTVDSTRTFAAGPASATLTVCALTETPAYVGRLFSFAVEGGPLVSVAAGDALADPSTWKCRAFGAFAPGTRVTVAEAMPAGTEIAWIDTQPAAALVEFDRTAATALVALAGATTVLFDDEPLPPPQTGFVEVCADRAPVGGSFDQSVLGPFTYTVTPSDGTAFDVTVVAGQCSGAYAVQAGIVHVVQHAVATHTVVGALTIPAGRLAGADLVNGSADAEVPVAAVPSAETQLHFVIRRDRASLTVCAALAGGAAPLDGTTFGFVVADLDEGGPAPAAAQIVARASAAQCVVAGEYPIGDRVDVEEHDAGPDVTTSGGGVTTIARGINTVTVTNAAWGRLAICSAPVAGLSTPPVLRFRVDGASLVAVRAGTCSIGARVTVASHTVAQLPEPTLELDPVAPGGGMSALPAAREVSKVAAALRFTVAVPFGSESDVLYANRVRSATVQVCARVAPGSEDALGRRLFRFGVAPPTGPVFAPAVAAGTCSPPSPPYPVVAADGMPTAVTVTALPDAYVVAAITASGARSFQTTCTGSGPTAACGRTATAALAPGAVVVSFTARAR